ncbi:FirrV-1-A48 precursor [Feldmannia irregularis virus a]|uniref:FirrV-1-A48 n=1 Tax=Feldmannia irregularis virus a TaxID=231992 RepID=Q6XM39_9PHYC|nr:FirrV-1-A48 precursor [Feldmannia irregularis virus a]AAR26872.1 FirrV-1-A48 precursor [Feldmannia irregularis virus a]
MLRELYVVLFFITTVALLLMIRCRRPTNKSRKSYAEFCRLATVDHKKVLGIPWIDLGQVATSDLPSYLKYKERLLAPSIDQGSCASCWSISVVQMLADRVSVSTNGKIKLKLSVQEMISCWDGHDGLACSKGGVPEKAYQYIIENGIGLAEDYPYEQNHSTVIGGCDRQRLDGYRLYILPDSVRSLCLDPYQLPQGSREYQKVIDTNIRNMKHELLLHGPFVCTIMVYQNLYDYDGLSVYEGHEGTEFVGGHSVTCIGYCDEGINGEEPGFDVPGGYWVIKNSWSDWPLHSPASQGYFYIKKGSNVCGIESRASSALVDPDQGEDIRANIIADLNESRYMTYSSYVNDPERQLYVTRVLGRKKSTNKTTKNKS